MEKAYSLQPSEIQQSEEIQNDRQRLLAQFGALTLDLETCRAGITACADRERTVTRGVIQRLGVTEFQAARIAGTNLLCQVPDTLLPTQEVPAAAKGLAPAKANGQERPTVKE